MVLLPVGFSVPSGIAADAVRSYRTVSPLPAYDINHRRGGFVSVALSLGSPPPDVIRHLFFWSPDFPLSQVIEMLEKRSSSHLAFPV